MGCWDGTRLVNGTLGRDAQEARTARQYILSCYEVEVSDGGNGASGMCLVNGTLGRDTLSQWDAGTGRA